jgi:hypothetical protein
VPGATSGCASSGRAPTTCSSARGEAATEESCAWALARKGPRSSSRRRLAVSHRREHLSLPRSNHWTGDSRSSSRWARGGMSPPRSPRSLDSSSTRTRSRTRRLVRGDEPSRGSTKSERNSIRRRPCRPGSSSSPPPRSRSEAATPSRACKVSPHRPARSASSTATRSSTTSSGTRASRPSSTWTACRGPGWPPTSALRSGTSPCTSRSSRATGRLPLFRRGHDLVTLAAPERIAEPDDGDWPPWAKQLNARLRGIVERLRRSVGD